MSVCPECNDAHLTQKKDKMYFECSNRHRFKLVKVKNTIKCNECGLDFDPMVYRVGWNAVKCPRCGCMMPYDF